LAGPPTTEGSEQHDATFDDAIERLVFLAKIDAGLAGLDAGEGIPHDEVKQRLGL